MNLERWLAKVGGWTEHIVWWHTCVHAWNYVILLGTMNKYNAGNEMHVFMLKIVWFYWLLWTNVMLELKCICSCSKLCCVQRTTVRCRNWVVYSELTFAAKSVLVAVKLHSLPKVCSTTNMWFAVEIELSAANEHLLPKVCWLQRIYD